MGSGNSGQNGIRVMLPAVVVKRRGEENAMVLTLMAIPVKAPTKNDLHATRLTAQVRRIPFLF